MKKLIFSVAFLMTCFIGFAQTNQPKKPDSTKQITTDINSNTALVQEKVWPINYTAARKDSVIIRPRPKLRTRIKL